ncbi:universal stress protein [Rhodoferax sp. GW822-FHT02A01]|uniref:universal stress protein n=1 Tax=Rhodoferax sp. GW822-FHT02A01 TaxID=3141537 RepID=UPI00315C9763
MFKHILIPTDGSDLSNAAITNGVKLAKEINARITGLAVTMPYHYFSMDGAMLADSIDRYEEDSEALALRNLKVLKDAASEAGVEYALLHRVNEHPYEEIINVAQEQRCDVIFQASHGRRGLRALLMGSETQKVLTHTKIPVLVFR